MPENINLYDTEDEEIDLKGLFFYVCKQWRMLILFLVIGALIGCGISFFKMKNAEDKLEPNREAVVAQYAEYQDLLKKTAAKADDSVILNMDPVAVYTGSLSYYVSCKDDDIDEVKALADTLLFRDDNWEKLYKASGLDCSMAAFRELVSVCFSKVEKGDLTDANVYVSDQGIPATESDIKNKKRGGYLNVSITSPSDENPYNILTEAERIVEAALKEYSDGYANMSYVQLKKDVSLGYSNGVADSQKAFTKAKKEYIDLIAASYKDLSKDELAYYEKHYVPESEWSEATKALGGFSKKWPVIGAAGLFFLCAIWFAIKYLINGSIKDEDEFGSQYGLKVFGSIKLTDEGKTGLDRWLDRLDASRSVEPVSEEYLGSLIKGLEQKSIALVEATACETENAAAAKLAAGDDRLVNAGCILTSDSSVSKVMDCDGIIVIAKLGKIRRQEIVRILELAQKFGKTVLGVVVVK